MFLRLEALRYLGLMRCRFAFVSVALAIVASCSDPTGPSVGCDIQYPPQSSSQYVLPYPPGTTFRVGQGNCSDGSHAPGTSVEFAYDLLMPIGQAIVAARGGNVLLVEERFTDNNGTAGEENFVDILHDDGTVAAYVHISNGGSLVAVGDKVAQGEVIARSGNTGDSTEPHLHFHVLECNGCQRTIPVTFRNTRPHPNGLVVGEDYTAN